MSLFLLCRIIILLIWRYKVFHSGAVTIAAMATHCSHSSHSTSGVPLESQPLTVTIAANSFHVARLSAIALDPGILVVRGVVVQMQNGTSREFLLPLATDKEEKTREKRKTIWNTQIDRIKESGLDARPWLRSKRVSMIQGKASKGHEESLTFMQCNIVGQPPLLRVRRTSLTHGAIMLYDGET